MRPRCSAGARWGWFTADLEGFPELADDLAPRGAAVVTVVYRTSDSGEYFPVPVEDVACGLGYAAEAVAGLDVSQVVIGGHSSGADMAALVAFAPDGERLLLRRAGDDGTDLLLWTAPRGPMNTVVTGEPGLVCARFSPGGDRLLLATERGLEADDPDAAPLHALEHTGVAVDDPEVESGHVLANAVKNI